MTQISTTEASQRPVDSDAALEERIAHLIGRACRRQVWILFLDAASVQLPKLVAMDDYPTSPEPCGARSFASHIRRAMDELGAERIVFVWERNVGERATPVDRAWAKAMATACRDEGVPARAQLISHRAGVRWFAPDDYE